MESHTVVRTVEARAVALLERLVMIPSPTGDTGAVTEAFVRWGEENGLHAGLTPTGAPWLSTLADPFSSASGRHILLFGHLDTVPGGIPVRRETRSDEGDVLWGRGSVDAKGAMAVFATVAAAWKESGRNADLTVIGAVDEEGDSETARWVQTAFAASPSVVVIGEPSGAAAVTLGYKGRLKVRISVRRELVHAGTPEASAADALVALLARFRNTLDERTDEAAGLFDRVTLTIKQLTSRSDGLHERAEAILDIRTPPGVDGATTLASFRSDPAHPEVHVLDVLPAHVAPRDTVLVRAFNEAIRAQGERPRHLRKTGTSDQCVLGPAWPEAEIVTYGPGDARLDHTPHERIRLDEVRMAVRVLGRALASPTH